MNDRNRNFNAELYRPRQDSPRRPSVTLYLIGVAAIFILGTVGYSLIEGGHYLIRFIPNSAVKEDENGAGTQKHQGFWIFRRRNPGTVRVSTENSKA
jgi:hypothetical protein